MQEKKDPMHYIHELRTYFVFHRSGNSKHLLPAESTTFPKTPRPFRPYRRVLQKHHVFLPYRRSKDETNECNASRPFLLPIFSFPQQQDQQSPDLKVFRYRSHLPTHRTFSEANIETSFHD